MLLRNDQSLAFSKLVIDECLRHFCKAATPALSCIPWGARPLEASDGEVLFTLHIKTRIPDKHIIYHIV